MHYHVDPLDVLLLADHSKFPQCLHYLIMTDKAVGFSAIVDYVVPLEEKLFVSFVYICEVADSHSFEVPLQICQF